MDVEIQVQTPTSRDSGNDFDRFAFPFLEVGSLITELFCDYPTWNANFKSCFSNTLLQFKWLRMIRNNNNYKDCKL